MPLWIVALVACGFAMANPHSALDAIERSLPESGVLHLRYRAEDLHGSMELWVDFGSHSVLQLARSRAHLRDDQGRYARGTGASTKTGETRGWDPDEPYFARTVLSLPHPISQATILLAERERITDIAPKGDGWVITWNAPDSKLLRWTEEGDVEIDCKTSLRFETDQAGQILSIQQLQSEPEANIGRIKRHDYLDAAIVNGMSIPRYIDPRGEGRRPPAEGVWELDVAEMLQDAPGPIFTRAGALQQAVAAAQPLVKQYRDNYNWPDPAHASTQDGSKFVDPTRKRSRASWSTAFMTAGSLVLALGAFAWWRSRH